MFHHDSESELLGVITKKTNMMFEVWAEGRLLQGRLAGGFKQNQNKRSAKQNYTAQLPSITVGDEVRVRLVSANEAVITTLLPRRSSFGRRAALAMPDKYPHEQVIAANVDQMLAIFSAAEPAPHWNLLDRYLVAAEDAGLKALICISKVDLLNQQSEDYQRETLQIVDDFRRIGYPVLFTSTRTGEGLEELFACLSGCISLMIGKSGVGKSSLINALLPAMQLRTGVVNPTTGKGRHTTTHLEMIRLARGGAVIDTPGMREFGLWDIPADELAENFPEMRPFLGKCKFGLDCAHDEEPGCAVRRAVMDGFIQPRRYRSYLCLRGMA
ncbi:MAG: ribosome small subunit-dependent GTPase A [Bellilinea sp.]|nr:ribosome small subunit-dependent GTPase A [Bellilinea sp.]